MLSEKLQVKAEPSPRYGVLVAWDRLFWDELEECIDGYGLYAHALLKVFLKSDWPGTLLGSRKNPTHISCACT